MQLDTNLTLHVCVKINSKANDRLEHEAWNHKNPRKNPGAKHLEIGHGDDFLDLIPKRQKRQK